MLSSDNTVISSNKEGELHCHQATPMSPAIKDYTFPRQHPCLQLQGRRITLSPGNTLDSSYKEREFHCHQATAPLSPATRKENSTFKRQCHWSRTLTSRRSVLQASSTTLFTRTIFPATKRWAAIGTRNQRKALEAAGSPPPSHSSRSLYTQTPRSPSSGK